MSGRPEIVGPAGTAARRMRASTVMVALVMIAVSIAVIVTATGFPTPMTIGAPGPGRLPILYAIVLIILSLGMIGAAVIGRPEPEFHVGSLGRILALSIWTVIYVALLPSVGFLALSIPWLFVSVRFLGSGWIASLITAFVLPTAVFVSFGMLLGVPLP